MLNESQFDELLMGYGHSKGSGSCQVFTSMQSHHAFALAPADDIQVERLVTPPVIIPTGQYWDELEAFWSDLVNELPNIPDGGNNYFSQHLKPSLGNSPLAAAFLCIQAHAITCGARCTYT